ncbi:TPA: oligosaccharide repeat unit polymerase [Streptococcus suis]|nr:oligosaccharide repeat unit polymerase [Streptococcus suis]
MIEITIYLNIIVTLLTLKIKLGHINNFTSIFNSWWGLLVFLSSRGFFGLNIPSENTFITVLIGMIGFNLSSILFENNAKLSIDNYYHMIHFKLRERFLIFIQLLVLGLMIPYFIDSLQIIISSGLPSLRTLVFDSAIDQFILYYLIEPLIVASMLTLLFLIFGNKKNKLLYLLIINNLILYTFTFGGRINFFRLTIFLILMAKLYETTPKLLNVKLKNLKSKRKSLGILGVAVLIGLYITIKRSAGDLYSVVEQIYIYFVGSFTLYDKLDLLGYPKNSDLLFGRATIGGFVDTIILFFEQTINVCNFTKADMAITKVNQVTSQYYEIGYGKLMNAFPTMFYIFRLDFGYFGVFVIPFLYGSILNFIKIKASKINNIKYGMIYVLLAYIGIFGSNRWEPSQFWFWGTLFYISLFFTEKKKGRTHEPNIDNNDRL